MTYATVRPLRVHAVCTGDQMSLPTFLSCLIHFLCANRLFMCCRDEGSLARAHVCHQPIPMLLLELIRGWEEDKNPILAHHIDNERKHCLGHTQCDCNRNKWVIDKPYHLLTYSFRLFWYLLFSTTSFISKWPSKWFTTASTRVALNLHIVRWHYCSYQYYKAHHYSLHSIGRKEYLFRSFWDRDECFR